MYKNLSKNWSFFHHPWLRNFQVDGVCGVLFFGSHKIRFIFWFWIHLRICSFISVSVIDLSFSGEKDVFKYSARYTSFWGMKRRVYRDGHMSMEFCFHPRIRSFRGDEYGVFYARRSWDYSLIFCFHQFFTTSVSVLRTSLRYEWNFKIVSHPFIEACKQPSIERPNIRYPLKSLHFIWKFDYFLFYSTWVLGRESFQSCQRCTLCLRKVSFAGRRYNRCTTIRKSRLLHE